MNNQCRWMLLSSVLILLSGCASQAVRESDGVQAQQVAQQLSPKLQQFYAKWRGVPYRYGGHSQTGVDCSALTQLIYQQTMQFSLPRTTEQQQAMGREVDLDELMVGDLLFFKTGWGKRHVGVFVGDGRFLHASTSKGVIISTFNNGYWRDHFWQARRVLNDD